MRKITFLFVVLLSSMLANAGTGTHQYAVTDIALLQADIVAGNYDIYELTTPGGNYQFTATASTAVVISKTLTIRAAANLYAKPILSINNTSTSSSVGIFTTATPSITITFQGLEFNGVNTNSAGSQPTLIWSTVANDNLFINDCYIHDFRNTSGNGLLKFDVTSTAQTIDIQNSILNYCSGRMIYIGAATATNLNFVNTTFSNLLLIASRGTIVYCNGVNTGTTTANHCTFYGLNIDSNLKIIKPSSGATNGATTFSNCIFDGTIATATVPIGYASTANNCYFGVAGSGAVVVSATTNNSPQSGTAPIYQNKLILDFTLTNKTSFTPNDASATIGNLNYYPALTSLSAPAKPNDATSIGATTFTASWSAVSGAAGYTVYVYNSTATTLIKSVTVETTSANISGLVGSTQYTYTVKALSDGTVNSNSVESPLSNTFTTTAVIVLTAPTVGSASAIGGTGFVANWTEVPNANGYTINVYNSVPALAKTVTVSGQTKNSALVTGLTQSTAYTYKVIALGDGAGYSNSAESAASAGFNTSTLISTIPTVGTVSNIGAESFVANWTSLPNILNYSVKVYDQSLVLVKTITTPTAFGASLNNACVTGLSLNTTYSYTVISNGDGVYTSTSTESASSGAFTTLATYPTALNTDFGDGTWGYAYPTPSTNLPVPGPSWSTNGFDIALGSIYGNISTGPKGEVHTNSIRLDSGTSAGFTFPTITGLSQIEIHAYSGSDDRGFVLNEWNGTAWVIPTEATGNSVTYSALKVYRTDKIETITIINIVRNSPVKLRIQNGVSSGLGITKIVTRNSQPSTLTAPTVGIGDNIDVTSFTAHWTPVDVNATGYEVKVYTNYELKKTMSVTGQATNSLAITGLQADSTYTFKVKALGDSDVTFSDSYQSAASVSFKTLSDTGTSVDNFKNECIITVSGRYIICSEIGNIELFNLQGSKLFEVKNTNRTTLDFSKGLYIVRFRTVNGLETIQKVIIK